MVDAGGGEKESGVMGCKPHLLGICLVVQNLAFIHADNCRLGNLDKHDCHIPAEVHHFSETTELW